MRQLCHDRGLRYARSHLRHVLQEPDRPMRALACFLALIALVASPVVGWDHWGGDQGGQKFSKLDQITPQNAASLVRAWAFHTGDLASRPPEAMKRTKFESTPL